MARALTDRIGWDEICRLLGQCGPLELMNKLYRVLATGGITRLFHDQPERFCSDWWMTVAALRALEFCIVYDRELTRACQPHEERLRQEQDKPRLSDEQLRACRELAEEDEQVQAARRAFEEARRVALEVETSMNLVEVPKPRRSDS